MIEPDAGNGVFIDLIKKISKIINFMILNRNILIY